MSSSRVRLTPDAYRVGWISALPLEMAAAIAMLDASHVSLPQREGDNNAYHLGEIGDHNIVIACLPAGRYGLTSAAVVAQQMLSTFPSIAIGLMVGIGGGAPSTSTDIRLGDVVVSSPTGLFPGVVQYDYGKTMGDGCFHRTGCLNNPPERLLTAISGLQAKHRLGNNNIAVHLDNAAKARPSMKASFVYPGAGEDILFDASYVHENDTPSCDSCDRGQIVPRSPRELSTPFIHYGLIASANQVMKDARTRDKIRDELGILCFEMEAAGLMNHFPCLVIRGICDYSDSHKNKQWQGYAAATAAAYARELLQSSVPSTLLPRHRWNPVEDSNLEISCCYLGLQRLALEYLASRDVDYESILWIDSSSRAMVEQSFEQISLRLESGTEGKKKEKKSGVDAVVEWLERPTNRSWIIVFDGVESMDDDGKADDFDIRDYFPASKYGHLLLVTTSPDLHLRLAYPGIEVQGVDDQTGASILLKCAGIPSQHCSSNEVGRAISRKLGGMPLAIEQAGSYLFYGMDSITNYKKNFETRFKDVTLKTPMRKYVGSYEKGRTLWTTFDLLHDTLQRKSPDSVHLLQLIAFLGLGRIPFKIITGVRGGAIQPAEASPSDHSLDERLLSVVPWLMELRSETVKLAMAVRELEASGFVKFCRREGDTLIESVTLHDLARSFLQSKVPQEAKLDIVASSLLLSGLHLYDGTQIPEENIIRRHMGRLLVVMEQFQLHVPNAMLQPPDGRFFQLCGSVAPLFARICRYSGKLDIAAHFWAIAIQHKALSDEGQPHLESLMEAAEVDSRLGDLGGAIDKYFTVVSCCESNRPRDESMYITAVGRLRESRESQQRNDDNSMRAAVATSAPKRMPQSATDEGREENEEVAGEPLSWLEVDDLIRIANRHGKDAAMAIVYVAYNLCCYYHRPFLSEDADEDAMKHAHKYHDIRIQIIFDDNGEPNPGFKPLEFGPKILQRSAEASVAKMVTNLQFAQSLAATFRSPALSDWLSSKEARQGDIGMIDMLVQAGEIDTAFCWAVLQPLHICLELLDHLMAARVFDPGRLFLEVMKRPWSRSAIQIMLNLGVCVDYDASIQNAALLCAVSANNETAVSDLLAGGADIRHRDNTGTTALHLAARGGYFGLIKLLLDRGAVASQSNNAGRTALHEAAAAGNVMTARALLEGGSNVNQTDSDGRTALHLATRRPLLPARSVVDILLEYDASIPQQDNNGRTVLHYEAARPVEGSDTVCLLINHHYKQCKSLFLPFPFLSKKIFINTRDKDGRTALHEAYRVGNGAIYKELLGAGGDPNILDNSGMNAVWNYRLLAKLRARG